VIVRASAIIGPHDYKPSQLGAVLLFMARGWLPVLTEGGHDWVDARDVAAGMSAAEARGRRGEGYLLGGDYLTLMELGRMVARHQGRRPPLWASPRALAMAGAPLAEWVAKVLGRRALWSPEAVRILGGNGHISSTKAEHELGYRSRPMEETVGDTLEWYRRQGML
jgi:dihydroflavonol-4-reductase